MLGTEPGSPVECLFWFGRDVMSRFTHPADLQQQQSCFCCSPVSATPDSTSENRGKHPIVTSLTRLDQQHPYLTSNAIQVDTDSVTNLISNFHIQNQEGCGSLNVNTFPTHPPPEIGAVEGSLSDLKINMHALQSRQLGLSLHNGRKFKSGSSVSVMHPESRKPDPETSNSPASASGSIMDLDMALDELGMLSTVTNSRHQYLSETRGLNREKKLQKKSQSSPNLASLSQLNGFRIIQLDSNYVTNVSCDKYENQQSSTVPFPQSANIPIISYRDRHEYRDPQLLETAASFNRRRSVPRMSRMRKDRYSRSRCPYRIPNRLCHSMQEADFTPDYFQIHQTQASSPVIQSNNQEIQNTYSSIQQSKSNGTSPAKGHQEHELTRSHSVEDLLSVQRRLELVFEASDSKESEACLDQIATQFTDLHMS